MQAERRAIPLAEAVAIAEELLEMLEPVTTRREVVGSVRRGKPMVRDIEILAEPALTPVARNLFGEVIAWRDELDCWCREQLDAGVFGYRLDREGRHANGERYKRLTYAGVALDLFICRPPASWGVLEAIRTGPAEFSRRLVTQRGFGGLLPFGFRVADGAVYRNEERVDVPDERALFVLLGLRWVEPAERQ